MSKVYHYAEVIHKNRINNEFYTSDTITEYICIDRRDKRAFRLLDIYGAIRYRFYDVEEDDIFCCKKNYSSWRYLGGKIYFLREFEKKFPEEREIIETLRKENLRRVIVTQGLKFIMEKGDKKVEVTI